MNDNQELDEIKNLYSMSITYIKKLYGLSDSDICEFDNRFEQINGFSNLKQVKYCIRKFVKAEMDYITVGERGIGRASTFYPRLGAYLRKPISRLNNIDKDMFFVLLEKNILLAYLAHGLFFSDCLPTNEFSAIELFKKWIPLAYTGDNFISKEHYNYIMAITSYSSADLVGFLKDKNIKGGGIFLKDKTNEILSMHIVAGLKLRAIEIGQVKAHSSNNRNLNYEGHISLSNVVNGYGTRYREDGTKKYEGNFAYGKFNGYGIYYYNNGDRYEGNFVNDRRHGKGTFYFGLGTKYKGDFVDDKMTGKGICYYCNGGRYEGDFVEGKRQGKGIYHYNDGSYYEGNFINGKRNGYGNFCSHEGSYNGDFVEDKKSGYGVIDYINGNSYEGDFVDDKVEGYGTYYYINGNRYEGFFVDNKMHGEGTFYYNDGNRYEGEFVSDKMTGKGSLYNENGVYKGDFIDGKMTGKGIFYFHDGDRYEGDFVEGEFNGHGIYYYNNGNFYEGEFEDDDFSGKGIFYFNDGSRYEGDFKYGDFNGHGVEYSKDGTKLREGYFIEGKYYDETSVDELLFEEPTYGDELKIKNKRDESVDESINGNSEVVKVSNNFDDLMNELNSLIGLDEVKKEVTSMINLIRIQQMRKENGLKTGQLSLHYVFTGNPGTGKTTVARLIGEIYKKIGVLSKGHFVEVDRSGLVAGYVGHTALKVKEVVEEAMGGVLFIDEAYSLYKEYGNDFGSEAIDTLLKLMEDNRESLMVIVAGYNKPMEKFLKSNPGLQSRFNKYIHFQDYSAEELVKIFEYHCNKNSYKINDNTRLAIKSMFDKLERKESFSNGRLARNLFEKLVVYQSNRVIKKTNISVEDLQLITIDDVQAYIEQDRLEDLN